MGEASDLIFKHKLWEERAKRIADLESRQREIGDQLSETDSLLLMIESFVQERCSMLEESINNRFPTLRWKLFDTQINGSIVDTCIAMIDCPSGLVNYDTANTAAQVNADLEIINVLSKHYDVYLPLFVDNSERVNVLAHTDSQIITLSVSTDSVMKIEKINEREVA